MKQCSVCKRILLPDQFAFKHRATGRRQPHCYDCQRAYCRAYYEKDKEAYKKRRLVRQRMLRQLHRGRIIRHLERNPCVDCGEGDVRVLEFDHVRGEKKGNISDMVRRSIAWQRIEEELAKCEVRCANCHRRKTVSELAWFRSTVGT